ncbi:hypothetical protein EBB07_04390, partial [Paenibacillaceae bacterium]
FPVISLTFLYENSVALRYPLLIDSLTRSANCPKIPQNETLEDTRSAIFEKMHKLAAFFTNNGSGGRENEKPRVLGKITERLAAHFLKTKFARNLASSLHSCHI